MKKRLLFIVIIAICALIISNGIQQSVSATIARTNTLVSYNTANTGIAGTTGNTIIQSSDDGNIVAWEAYYDASITTTGSFTGTFGGVGIYKRNLKTGVTEVANLAYDNSFKPLSGSQSFAMSRTGRFVAWSTQVSGVVQTPIVTSVNKSYLYLRDTLLNTTKIVSVNEANVLANIAVDGSVSGGSISDDGRYVTFSAVATNLLSTGTIATSLTDRPSYIKDMLTGKVINAATSTTGDLANAPTGGIITSCEGSIGIFSSAATNLTPQDTGTTNTYIVDLRNGYNLTNISFYANAPVFPVDLSCNGRYVVVRSAATNLTSDIISGGKIQYFRYDRLTGQYDLISKSTSGYVSATTSPGKATYSSRIVGDNGKVVFFDSDGDMVSPTATFKGAGNVELYVRDPEAGTTELVPVDAGGIERGISVYGTTEPYWGLSIAGNGNSVTYLSEAANLVPGIGSIVGKKIVQTKL